MAIPDSIKNSIQAEQLMSIIDLDRVCVLDSNQLYGG